MMDYDLPCGWGDSGVTRVVKAARDRLPDRVVIGVLTKTFPPELVDAVVEQAQAREQRNGRCRPG
jgi:hypothetical protein